MQNKNYSSEINKAAGSDVEWEVITRYNSFIIVPHTNLCSVNDYYAHNEEKRSWFVISKNYVLAKCHDPNHTRTLGVSSERVVTGPISDRIRKIFYSDVNSSELSTENILLVKVPNENYYLLYEYEKGVSIDELNKEVLISILSSSGMFFNPNYSKYSRTSNICFIGIYEFTDNDSLKLTNNATYLEGPIMYFKRKKASNNSNANNPTMCVMKTSYKRSHIIYEYNYDPSKLFITNEKLIDCVLQDMLGGHMGFYFNPSGCDDLIKYKLVV